MAHDPEEQDEMMNCGIGIAERDLLQAKLRRLPDTPPPRAVWQRIEEQARAEGLFASKRFTAPVKWMTGSGIAAAVVLAVLNVTAPTTVMTVDSDREFPTEPRADLDLQGNAREGAVRLQSLNALMVQSQQLEQDLRSLPSEPHLVRAGTAATIAAVEDQIAAIDHRLNYAPVRTTQGQMELYWRERVRLMNLLVQLRTAQAHRNAF